MDRQESVIRRGAPSVLATHQVLRRTYMLLSATLIFSAITAWFSLQNPMPMNFLVMIVGMYGLLFLTYALRNSIWGILSVFAFTGFLGYTLGPILNAYLHMYTNGAALVMTSLGATGFIFVGLSAYVLVTGKDFTFMGGMLTVAILVAFLASIGAAVFHMPMMSLVTSGAFAIICSGLIMYHTSMIINGGERNFIMATINLYVAIYNIFLSLLQLLAAFAGNRD